MLTPDDLRKMTPEDRTALFDRLCTAHYGDRKTDTAVGADFDVRRETVVRWRKENIVPWSAIFALDGWLNSTGRAEQIMQHWGSIPEDLARATAQLGRVTKTLSHIAQLSAVPSADDA